jgi:hypothetical protein
MRATTIGKRAQAACISIALLLGACLPSGKPGEPYHQCPCPEPLVCNTGLPPPFCRPVGSSQLGDPCSDDYNCASGLTCNFGYPNGRCEPPYTNGEGAPCGHISDCKDGLRCTAELKDGRCAGVSKLPAGAGRP